MRISSMRKLDEYVGPLVCVLLIPFLYLRRILSSDNSQKDKDVSRILVIKFWGMGSILLSTPMLKVLRKKFPHSEITLLTLRQNKDICELLPSVDQTLCLEVNQITTFPSNFVALVYQLRKKKFDIVIDLEFFTNFSCIVTFLTGTEYTIGFYTAKFWRSPFYKKGVAFDHTKHIVDIFLKLAKALGPTDTKDIELEAPVITGETKAGVDGLLSANNIDKEDYVVCININASSLSEKRRLPVEYFAEIVESLRRYPQVKPVLIGAEQDSPYVSSFLKSIKPPTPLNLCGKLEIKELVALMDRTDLFIGNDSGPLHLAVVLGTKTVSFFGPETPNLYGPRDDHHRVFYSDLYCSPCLNVYESKKMSRNCSTECMKEINVADVIKAIGTFIDTHKVEKNRLKI